MNQHIDFSRIFFVAVFSILIGLCANSQQKQIIEDQARKELQSKGITEDELRNHLATKGIDVDGLDNLSEAEVMQLQDEIKLAIKELEDKKSKPKSINAPSAIDDKSNRKLESVKDRNNIQTHSDKQGVSDSDTSNITGTKNDSIAIWGQHIFRNKSLKLYQLANDIKPPPSYILGTGDQISVSIWGISQLNEVYELNQEGYILPQRMPRIFLKGVALSRAHAILQNYFKRFYRFEDNQFSVSLNYSRTINVNIFGEVYNYGGYTLPAINTGFNALVAAGGPTNIGSVRKIKLIRKGVVTYLDVYKFMENPVLEKDYYLENNDIIQVPVADKVVSISGAVNRPFQYELLHNEELNHLIIYAGGLKPNAILKTIQVERIQNDRKIILDVPYADLVSKGGDFALKKGDKVRVFSIQTETEELIYVKGEVRTEASYQYINGLKLSQLLKRIEFTPESNVKFAFIKRKNTNNTFSLIRVSLEGILQGNAKDDIDLRAQDELIVYKQSVFVDKSFVVVHGAVRLPGNFNIHPDQDVRIKDILFAGGLKPDAFNFGFLFRLKSSNLNNYEIVRLPVKDIMEDRNDTENIFMRPYDSLVVLSQSSFSEQAYVEISGAVKLPGRYSYGQGMSARDLISLASGFTYFAATNKIDVFRVIIKNNEPTKTIVKSIVSSKNLEEQDADFKLDPYDIVVVRSQPEFQFQQMVQLEGELRFPGPYALLSPNEKISDIINRAGGLTAEAFPEGATLFRANDNIGYVVLDLKEALAKPNSRFNFILKESDVIFIPKQKDLVRISGATNAKDLYPDKMLLNNNTISVAFHEGKSAKFYIDHYAAGVSETGDPKKITVEHANGKISKTGRFLFFRTYPEVYKGSVINVGLKETTAEKQKKVKKDVDWGKVVADTIGQATAILSLILLIDRLN
jgi:protein involved in polysaccharide export with SLBB domain